VTTQIVPGVNQLIATLGEKIKAVLTWRNITLVEGTEVTLVVIPMFYNPATDAYQAINFTEGGVLWTFSVCKDDAAPAKDAERTVELLTVAYATITPEFPVLAASALVGPRTTFTTLIKDERVVAIRNDQLAAWLPTIYAARVFPDVLQILPGAAFPVALVFEKG